MQVEIKHHYGWKTYDVPATTLAEAAYLAVRASHGFLNDENHSHTAGAKSFMWGGKEVTFNSVCVYREGDAPPSLAPAWLQTDYWFAVEYRAPEESTSPAEPVVVDCAA